MNQVPLGLALKAGFTSGIAAAVLNSLIYEVAAKLLRMSFLVPQSGDGGLAPITVWMVVFASLLPALAACLLFWLLLKMTNKGMTIFRVTAYLILAASLYLPFSQTRYKAEASVLALMHIVAAALIIRKLKKAAREGVTSSEPAQTIQPMVS